MPRHRKPSTARTQVIKVAATTGTAAALTIGSATTALAAPDDVWAGVIDCESGGNPTAQNPNSTASGLYQIIDGTWAAFGGLEFATKAKYATPEQQRIVAERILAGQGPNAWAEPCNDPLNEWIAAGSPTGPIAPPAPPAPVAPETVGVTGDMVVAEARKHLGANYVWGGESDAEGGYDCSGLIFRAYADLGIDVPRTSAAFSTVGVSVPSLDQAQPGDILHWPGHVAMYVGNGMVIHASQPGTQVHERAVWGTPTIRRILTGSEQVTAPPAPPAPPAEAAPVEPQGQPEAPSGDTYTVVPGDNLTKIAPRVGADNWQELYEANREVIGDNPNLIYPGQVYFVDGLLLPQAPVPVEVEPVVETHATGTLVPGATYTSGVGFRAEFGATHHGIDLAAPVGTPIYSPVSGRVDIAGERDPDGFGAVVYMTADNGDVLWFGHISTWHVQAGDRVEAGQLIAEVGDRGQSTGPHLHFEVHDPHLGPIDPQPWLANRGIDIGPLN